MSSSRTTVRPLLARIASMGAIGLITIAAPPGGFTVAEASAAGSLVYVKDGNVYIAQSDGNQARAITTGDNGWAWPSETDTGIIAVAGGLSRTDGEFDPSGSDEIYEFDQQRQQIAGPVPTQATSSTVNAPD